jgi:uncharacterized integral membrane protein (TIGR00697 family)
VETKKLLNKIPKESQNLKYFYIFSMIYVAAMMMSLTVSARLIPFNLPYSHIQLILTAGTWTIPLTFLVQDITTEVYGYVRSRRLIQICVLLLLFYIGYTKLTTYMPIPGISNIDQSYNEIFTSLPRHLLALIVALYLSNISNDYILSKLKIYFKGKYLSFRFIASTSIGEIVLQVVGTSIAWLGHLSFSTVIIPFVLFSYFYKIIFQILLTPLSKYICNKLKSAEGIDVYDADTNFNPFSIH